MTLSLLLTATIRPGNTPFLKRKDPKVREADYLIALEKWLKNFNLPIVFCENSYYDISNIRNILQRNSRSEFEILQFDGRSFSEDHGKGYGEFLIMKYALENSEIVNNSQYLLKVTGRYFIKNASKIMKPLLKDNDIYVMADLKRSLTWADSRVFAFKPSFISNYLSEYQDMINDSKGFYLEHALARAVLRAISDGYRWIPLPHKPIIIGYSGTSDTPYRTSNIRWLAGEIIHYLKNYLNKKY